jgi:hypothetical protein
MAVAISSARRRDTAPGSKASERALARLRARIQADMHVACETRAVRGVLHQDRYFTDRRGVRLPILALSRQEAQAALRQLRRQAAWLYRGELAAYLCRRYPHPRHQDVFDIYLAHLRDMTASEWIESRPLWRALERQAEGR